MSLGSIVAAGLVPLWTLFYYGLIFPGPHLVALVVTAFLGCGLIVAKHHENIGRLIRGTESKFGERVATAAGRGES
jgi:glycerol-3-phosphate acyltransferase PlsY